MTNIETCYINDYSYTKIEMQLNQIKYNDSLIIIIIPPYI
jgi:hypothetical protein